MDNLGLSNTTCMTINQYDRVELLDDLNPNIRKGMEGIILEIWDRDFCEVEFLDEHGANIEYNGSGTYTINKRLLVKVGSVIESEHETKMTPMIRCGINGILLLATLLFLGVYVWFLGQVLAKNGTISMGSFGVLTVLFSVPIYVALFQVKTIKIKDGLLTIFYPFRLWRKTYELSELEKWKYRKTSKVLRCLNSRFVTIRFRGKMWLTVFYSWGLTNFDDLLGYFNEHHKELRANSIYN